MNWLTTLLTIITNNVSKTASVSQLTESVLKLGTDSITVGELSAALVKVEGLNFSTIKKAFDDNFGNLSQDAILAEQGLDIAATLGIPAAGWLEDAIKVIAFFAAHAPTTGLNPSASGPGDFPGWVPTTSRGR